MRAPIANWLIVQLSSRKSRHSSDHRERQDDATECPAQSFSEGLDHRFLDEVRGLGPATLENLRAFIRAEMEDAVPDLCAGRAARHRP
jgi:hypothetical protein